MHYRMAAPAQPDTDNHVHPCEITVGHHQHRADASLTAAAIASGQLRLP
jgi:hypothetical protein